MIQHSLWQDDFFYHFGTVIQPDDGDIGEPIEIASIAISKIAWPQLVKAVEEIAEQPESPDTSHQILKQVFIDMRLENPPESTS